MFSGTVPVLPDPEFDALYRICRRSGFRESALDGRSKQELSEMIACVDRGMRPRILSTMTAQQIHAQTQAGRGSNQSSEDTKTL